VDHLSAMDCVMVPRRIFTEGAMNKVIEPMAVGLPVFGTPFAVAYAKMSPSFNVLVFGEDDMVSAVNRLLFDDELMQRIGNNARLTIQKYYSQELAKVGLIHLIEELPK
jgi:glycosyltransferase involved in cell wall biosynthesis